jgi:hypothetical protein
LPISKTLIPSNGTFLNSCNKTTGKVYTSVILAQNRSFKDVMKNALSSLHNQYMGIYPKATDHKNASDVCWFLTQPVSKMRND